MSGRGFHSPLLEVLPCGSHKPVTPACRSISGQALSAMRTKQLLKNICHIWHWRLTIELLGIIIDMSTRRLLGDKHVMEYIKFRTVVEYTGMQNHYSGPFYFDGQW
jgi:hypothetical protein